MKIAKVWKHATSSTLTRLALALLAVSAAAGAATLTEAEKKEGLAQLDRTRIGVIEATKGSNWSFVFS